MRYLTIALLLAGCAGQPAVQTLEVRVPVQTPCIESMPEKPIIQTQAEILKMGDWDATFALNATVLQYEAYTPTLEAVLRGCLKP